MIDCNRAQAQAIRRLSQFQFKSLTNTSFGKIFAEMNIRNEHRAFQCLDFIINVQKEIYDPLKDL